MVLGTMDAVSDSSKMVKFTFKELQLTLKQSVNLPGCMMPMGKIYTRVM